jgi:carboxymethylenebutenolidase
LLSAARRADELFGLDALQPLRPPQCTHQDGAMVTDAEESAHLLAPRVRAEVYWGHPDQDPSMTPENIRALDEAMDDAGLRHTTELYEGAQHGYTMSDTTAYNEAASERHFAALFALL